MKHLRKNSVSAIFFFLQVLMCSYCRMPAENLALRSPIYGFFKSDIKIVTEKNRTYHFFKCAAKHCKNKCGGVRCYQDFQDCAATSNLKSHAIKCFGANAVDAAFQKGSSGAQDGLIFASFAQIGQTSVIISHRAHTTDETRFVICFPVLAYL